MLMIAYAPSVTSNDNRIR